MIERPFQPRSRLAELTAFRKQAEQLSGVPEHLNSLPLRLAVPASPIRRSECSLSTAGLRSSKNLLARLQQARAETDRLFDHVKPEFLYERPIPERHRIVFYVGHLEAFDWNLLRERVLGRTSFHSEFDNLFAFGIDPVDGGLPQTSRPTGLLWHRCATT